MNKISLMTIGWFRRVIKNLTELHSTSSVLFKSVLPSRQGVLVAGAAALCVMWCQSAWAAVVTETFTTSGAITFPAGVTDVKVEVWGSGGGGGSATKTTTTCFGGGGGGGAYARLDAFTITEGSNYVYTVGAAGAANGGNGNPSHFIDPVILNAEGGAGGVNATDNNASGGAGGAVGTTGDAQYAGGTGGTVVGNPTIGAQGGSSAGSASAGNDGSYGVAGETAAVVDGGPGGASSANNASAPSVGPGGGGGGARRAGTAGSFSGGAGAAGQIRFTYTVPDAGGTNTTTTVASSLNPSYVGQPVTFTATIAPEIGSDVPTGTVQFKVNSIDLGTPVAVTPGTSPNGTASITTSDLSAGTQTITAEYSATGNFNGSSGTLPGGQTVTSVTQFVWNNPGSGEWNTATNWTPAGPPVGSLALIDNGGTAEVTADASYAVNSLRVGYGAGNSGTLRVGADLTVAATANSFIGYNGTGLLDVTNGTLQFTGTSLVRFGVNSGATGSFTQSGGVVAAGPSVHFGVNAGASYTLTDGALFASNNLVAGINAGSIGTITQSGGNITVGSSDNATSGQFWLGQNSVGEYNLSAGTFTARAVYVGSGNAGTGSGTLNQTGGTIDLVNGPAGAGVLLVGPAGTGVYSISNGILIAESLAITNGTVNIHPGSTISLLGPTNSLTLDAVATLSFAFGASGVSSITAAGAATVDGAATINVDGAAYTGGSGIFTLIEAASFEGTPVINLANFALGASYAWNTNNGNFTVTVGTVLPAPTLTYAGGTLSWPGDYLGWYAQSNSVNLANTSLWSTIAGSDLVTNLTITPNPALTNVFYRLSQSP